MPLLLAFLLCVACCLVPVAARIACSISQNRHGFLPAFFIHPRFVVSVMLCSAQEPKADPAAAARMAQLRAVYG
jgi:hypothetical protein